MLLVLCSDPLEPDLPDRSFAPEIAAIERLGIEYVLIDHDAITSDREPARAVRRVPARPEPALAAYRGWMTTPGQYARLYAALAGRGVLLINDPDQYRHAHYLPEWYPALEKFTPKSVWITGDLGIDRIMAALAGFGDAPVVLKDFVKSRKHEWLEACFIPSATDRAAVSRVVARFLDLQGDDLAEGLVFREYVEFRRVGVHPKSGLPLAEEHRTFWLDGAPVFSTPYWEGAAYDGGGPPLDDFLRPAAAVRSRFFAMDLARRPDGGWSIVELGDGQVSGLPQASDAERYYSAIAAVWPTKLFV